MNFSVTESREHNGLEAAFKVRAIHSEITHFTRDLLEEALNAGQRMAESEAPRGPILERNEERRISDAIGVTSIRYSPGGAGGGGFYEGSLYADGAIAPHLRYVYEGTADEGTGKIYPSRGNMGALALHKGGEQIRFRRWVHGQKPQTQWWDLAQETVGDVIDSGINAMQFGTK